MCDAEVLYVAGRSRRGVSFVRDGTRARDLFGFARSAARC